jgi:competence protein ComEA
VPDLSRGQLVVYAATAIAVLLLGARWVRDGSSSAEASAPEPRSLGGLTVERGSGELVVHVAGEVADPGVYRLKAGSRVADAVEHAGGPTRDALIDAINLAAKLADGQQVVVPAAMPGGVAVGPGATALPDAPISLGTATVEQLDTIEGIGPVTAADIVEFRDSKGGLSSIDELDQVAGIGPATMEALRAGLQP